MKRIYLSIVALFFAGSAFTQNTNLYDWDTDLDYLAEELPKRHYDFFSVKSKTDFLSGLEKIKAGKNNLTDYGIAVKVQQLIAGFGDSHTRFNLEKMTDENKILPLHLFWFADGLFILHTTQENAEILGHRIISVNGTPLETIVDSLATLITVDNKAMLKMSVPWLLPRIQILEAFGFAKQEKVELELQDLNGNRKVYFIKPALMTNDNRKTVQVDSVAFCNRNESALFVEHYQTSDRMYYLQYNKCWGSELESQYGNEEKARQLPSFDEFERKVFGNLKTNPVDKIVFDIRYNGGGSSPQGSRFIEKLAEYLAGNPQTKVYVVLGRATFSSAILNAMDFKRLTDAVFVGEETAGKPNHFGEVRGFRLPSSGMTVSYSTKYFKQIPEDMNTLTPDIKLEPRFLDFIKGIDSIYEWIYVQ